MRTLLNGQEAGDGQLPQIMGSFACQLRSQAPFGGPVKHLAGFGPWLCTRRCQRRSCLGSDCLKDGNGVSPGNSTTVDSNAHVLHWAKNQERPLIVVVQS